MSSSSGAGRDMAAKRKPGRPKEPPAITAQPMRGPGRPASPLPLQDEQRHLVALVYACTLVEKRRTRRGHRKLGANRTIMWLAALIKAKYIDDRGETRIDLLKGQAAGEVPGAPEGFVTDCPDGFVPVVPMRPGSNEPRSTRETAGLVKTLKNKISGFLDSRDAATVIWFVESVEIFCAAIVSIEKGNPAIWIEALARASNLGDQKIIECLRGMPGAPKLSTPRNFSII
jgi:hypothetical protein